MSNLKDQIRAAGALTADEYKISAWDAAVEIRSMTARQRADLVQQMANNGTDTYDVMLLWSQAIVSCVFDPDSGEPLFTDDDMEWLFDKEANIVQDLATECLRASGMANTSLDEAGKDSSVSPTSGED